jgi:hypothetical protein
VFGATCATPDEVSAAPSASAHSLVFVLLKADPLE